MADFINEQVETLSQSAEDHKKVYHYLYNCNLEEVKVVASSLHDLRFDRNASDYELRLDKFNDPNLVSLLFKKAEIAFNDFENIIRNGSKCRRIVKGIQQYKQKINS